MTEHSRPTDRSAGGVASADERPLTQPDDRQSVGVGGSWSRRRVYGSPALGYLMVLPLVICMLLIIGYPLVNAVLLSLRNEAIMGSPSHFIGLGNYATIVASAEFWTAMGRSAIWMFGNLLVQALLAFGAAILLSGRSWIARHARVWVLLPWVIPTVAIAVIWKWLLNSSYGVVNKLALVLHFIDHPLNVFGERGPALAALILVNSWHWFPLGAVIIFGAMQTVSSEIYEAARIDGANAWQAFWRITFPLLDKVLFALGLVGSLWTFNILDTIYLITKGGPSAASTTAPIFIYDTAFEAFRSSQAAAASVISVIVLAIAAVCYVRFARPKER